MSSTQRMLIHLAAGLVVPVSLFANLPSPLNLIVGGLAAAAIAFFAFLDQSLSAQQ
jgi:hypothetical protein